MPHLLIERLRSFEVCTCTAPRAPKRKDSPLGIIVLEVFDIAAAIIFIIGSVCFHPAYAKDLDVFVAGCVLFVVGAVIYVVICSFTLFEAVQEKGAVSWEAGENWMYFIGSWIFLIGTFLYWPKDAHHVTIEKMQEYSLGQYFNLLEPEFEGSILFIIGSVMFAFAAFFNAMHQKKFDEWTGKMLSGITSLYMGGALLFCMGSVAFLPGLGCNEQMVTIGAWAFIIGSVLYFIGAVMGMWRTLHMLNSLSSERIALVGASNA